MTKFSGALLGRAMSKGLCYLVLAACWLVFCSQTQASLSHPAVVSENPADTTPHIVLDAESQKVYGIRAGRYAPCMPAAGSMKCWTRP